MCFLPFIPSSVCVMVRDSISCGNTITCTFNHLDIIFVTCSDVILNGSRVSVIRGRVVTPDSNGLTGIRISVATDPQFGFTLTRPDGWFDILVNGGSMVTLQFQRSPFHPIKRTVLVAWNEIVVIQTPIIMAAGSDADHLYSLTGSASSAADSFLSSMIIAPDPFLYVHSASGGITSHQRLSSLLHAFQERINGSFGSSSSSPGVVCFDHNYEKMRPRILDTLSSSIPHSNSESDKQSHSFNAAGVATQESAGIGESQTLQETITVPGTSSEIKLSYRSSSSPGYLSTIHLQLTSNSRMPSTLKVIHLRVVVEGNLFTKLFEPDSNLKYTFAWNKRNVYRQKVYGLTTAKGKSVSVFLVHHLHKSLYVYHFLCLDVEGMFYTA